MKKILIIIFLISGICSYSQPNWNTSTQGGKTTQTYFLGAIKADSGILIPKLNSLTTNRFKDSLGAIAFYQDSLYLRTNTGWRNIGRATSSGNTIYTGDGTLSSNRTINGNSKYLYLDSLVTFRLEYGSSISLNATNSSQLKADRIVLLQSGIIQLTTDSLKLYSPSGFVEQSVDTVLTLNGNGYIGYKLVYNNGLQTLQDVTDNGYTTTDSIIAASFKRTGGTSSQFLKANGSVDNNTYLTSASLTGYVPYTGATSDVDLGAFALNAASVKINGTNGNGHLHLRHQASDATATGQSTALFANSNGDLKWKNDGNYYTTLQTYKNNANRVYTYQNKSYTLADSTTLADSVSALRTAVNTKGSGTVTSVATGLGLSGGTITTSGTLLVDTSSTSILSRQRAATTYLPLTGGTLTSRLTGTSLILNKDSLPITTGRIWGLVSDTSNGGRISRQILNTGTVTSVAALTLGTSGNDLSSTVANSTTTPVITLNVPTASGSNRGVLSSADWTTFNGKFTLPSLTSGSVLFSNGTTISQNNSNFFWDNTNSRLGISTTSPQTKLHVVGNSSVSEVARFTNETVGTAVVIENGSTPTAARNNINFRQARGSLSIPSTVQTGDFLGSLLFAGYQDAYYSKLSIDAIVDGTVSSSTIPTALVISVSSTSAARAETMRLSSAGNLLLGNTTGTDKLTVTGNLNLNTAGNKLKIATGSNASVGVSAAMTAGTITISTTAVTSSSRIFLTHATLGGTQGILSVGTIVNGTSFVINSSSILDTGTVNWFIIN